MTLPVERNASTRALSMLEQTGLATGTEANGARRVLRAAALTYLTGLGQHVARFLFFVFVVAAGQGLWRG